MLELTKGSVDGFDILLLNENDVAEDLALADQARFVIKDGYSATGYILSLATGGAGLTIGTGKLSGTMTQGQADALQVGTFIGEASVRLAGIWRHTDSFLVKILNFAAPNSIT